MAKKINISDNTRIDVLSTNKKTGKMYLKVMTIHEFKSLKRLKGWVYTPYQEGLCSVKGAIRMK